MDDHKHRLLELAQKSAESQRKAEKAYSDSMKLFDKIDAEIASRPKPPQPPPKRIIYNDDNITNRPITLSRYDKLCQVVNDKCEYVYAYVYVFGILLIGKIVDSSSKIKRLFNK